MTTPRAHAELAKLYFSDREMKCWEWVDIERAWRIQKYPRFYENGVWHVGKTEPTEPPQIMCELAGVEFPMPAQGLLQRGQGYYFPSICDPKRPIEHTWDGWAFDNAALETGLIQLTKEGAVQQALAMAAALKQAIEKAKEQMK